MNTAILVLLIIDAVILLGIIAYLVVMAKKKCCPECAKQVEVIEEVAEKQEEPKAEEIAVASDEDDLGDDREIIKRVPFAEKMLGMDVKTQGYYNELNNMFKSMRKINARVSTKGVSYRLGRELVAKITVRGKTMKLHLALDVNAFDWNIYFQKDLKDVKAYAEVPFTVKVRSDRGMKNAVKLVEALAVAKAIEKKTRFTPVDSIAALKA